MRKFVIAVSIIINAFAICTAHDIKIIHPLKLAGRSKQQVMKDMGTDSLSYRELSDYFNICPSTFENDSIPALLLPGTQGTVDEDLVDPAHTHTRYHFYHAVKHYGLWDLELGTFLTDAITHGWEDWQNAIYAYGKGQKTEAYKLFGRYLHLMQDMSVPAHVFNDTHLPIVGSDDFEGWLKNPDSAAVALNGTAIHTVDAPDKCLDELAVYTYKTVRVSGLLNEDVNTPATGEIATMFPSQQNAPSGICYMEYVDVLGAGLVKYWAISGVGDYKNPLTSDSWWECERFNDDLLPVYFYIENTSDARPAVYKGVDNTTTQYSLCRLYATSPSYGLTREAINYGAGLMKYFHDLVNAPPYVQEVEVTQNSLKLFLYGNHLLYHIS